VALFGTLPPREPPDDQLTAVLGDPEYEKEYEDGEEEERDDPLIGIIFIVQLPLLPEAHPLQQFPPQLFTDDLL